MALPKVGCPAGAGVRLACPCVSVRLLSLTLGFLSVPSGGTASSNPLVPLLIPQLCPKQTNAPLLTCSEEVSGRVVSLVGSRQGA